MYLRDCCNKAGKLPLVTVVIPFLVETEPSLTQSSPKVFIREQTIDIVSPF